MKHLQNIIRRTNLPTKVKDNFRAVQDFISVVTEAHIVAAALTLYKMKSRDSEPVGIAAPEDPLALNQFMLRTVGKLLDTYVSKFFESIKDTDSTPDSQPSQTDDDGVGSYASLVMGYGLMAENMHDACKEGDGDRLARCWKFLLLHFKGDGRTKYALEAFRFIVETSGLLSPRKAHQAKWNRTCNPKGGCGNNVPLDLNCDFLNRTFKDNVNTFLPHITTRSVERSSQSLEKVNDTLANFDSITHVHRDGGHHVLPDTLSDFSSILNILQSEKVFVEMPDRTHSSFSLSADPYVFVRNNTKKFYKWLQLHKKHASIEQQLMYPKNSKN